MADETADAPQRRTAKGRVALVVSILEGETSVPAGARKHWLSVAEIEEWWERFLLGPENALRTRPKLVLLKEATKDRPFPPRTSDE